MELTGTEGSFITKERANGFHAELQNHPNMRVAYTGAGDFDRMTAQRAMENIIMGAEQPIHAVFAHSDEDGLGALQALKIAGRKPMEEVVIVSINGVQDVLKAIIAEEYLATVESSPELGRITVEVIFLHQKGVQPPPYILKPYRVFSGENALQLFAESY